ncbi:MAG: hypothetical protein AABX40_03360 [Candidatus Hydrothermarchaeota archaeon]
MLEVVVNPLTREAKGLVKETGPLSEIPEAAFELARKKVLWRKEGQAPPRELVEMNPDRRDVTGTWPSGRYDPELDVVSYHLLYLVAGLLSTPYSGETRLVKDVTHLLVKASLEHLEARAGPEGALSLMRDLLDPQELVQSGRDYRLWGTVIKREVVLAESLSAVQGMKGMAKADTTPSTMDRRRRMFAVDWKAFLPLLGTKELRLTDWYIVSAEDETGKKRSCILVSLSNLLDLYARLVAAEVLGYMNTVREKGKGLQVHERLRALGETLRTVSGGIYKPAATLGTPKSLNPGHFPPCIRYTLEGVTTGSRNYAISVLLTSFLSYARIAPQGRDSKISDYLKDMAVITEEILPLIRQAAERCQPPLFEDQPLERLNVHYHLGFGLRGDIKLEDSGASKWYFPPNCEKIQRESPPLCRPDDFCKRIKNPLHYYFLKEREAGGKGSP